MKMEPSRLPTPSNLSEITAKIVKEDMEKCATIQHSRHYSDAYLNGKNGLTDFTVNYRKRGASSDFEEVPTSSRQPCPGPSHVITGFHITATIKPMQPSTSTPQSHILSEWKSVVQKDIQDMKNLKKTTGHSDAYLFYTKPSVRRAIIAQKIHSPIESLKESVQRIMGVHAQKIVPELDSDETVKESLRFSLAKRIKNKTTNNPDCSDHLIENIQAVFK